MGPTKTETFHSNRCQEQVSSLTAQIKAVRGETAALAEVIRVKDSEV